jgi:transcriptional regulator with AAA-type ATPase domain
VVSLELSPLRERSGDILPLTRHFIEVYSRRLGYGPISLTLEAEHKLKHYSWPGNIRELENVIHHTLLICRDGLIQRDDLRLSNLRIERQDEHPAADESADALLTRAFHALFEQQAGALHEKVEDNLLRAAYRFSHYNQVHTANLLGLSRNITRTRLIKIGELAVNKRRPAESTQVDGVLQLSI